MITCNEMISFRSTLILTPAMVKQMKEIRSKQSTKLETIDLIVYDFDGVMTNNRVLVFQDGTEAVIVNRADGLGVNLFRSFGIRQLILSTETNPVVESRAAKLDIEVIASCNDKRIALKDYCEKNHYDLKRVLYVGNDVNDLEAMKVAGWSVAPADAHPDVLRISHIITKAKGGYGVVRELFDILTSQNGSKNEE